MDNKEIESWIRQARNATSMDTHNIEKYAFQSLLSGMIIKILGKKGPKAERQLAALNRMDDFLERLTQKNCIFHFQGLTITAQDRQISILQQEKMELIKEIETLKENIEDNA